MFVQGPAGASPHILVESRAVEYVDFLRRVRRATKALPHAKRHLPYLKLGMDTPEKQTSTGRELGEEQPVEEYHSEDEHVEEEHHSEDEHLEEEHHSEDEHLEEGEDDPLVQHEDEVGNVSEPDVCDFSADPEGQCDDVSIKTSAEPSVKPVHRESADESHEA